MKTTTEQPPLNLRAALELAVRALNAEPRFKVGETDSYSIAAACDRALAASAESVVIKESSLRSLCAAAQVAVNVQDDADSRLSDGEYANLRDAIQQAYSEFDPLPNLNPLAGGAK